VHHRIALFPSKRHGVQHINHQVESIDDVMRSYYFLRERNVRIRFGPGGTRRRARCSSISKARRHDLRVLVRCQDHRRRGSAIGRGSFRPSTARCAHGARNPTSPSSRKRCDPLAGARMPDDRAVRLRMGACAAPCAGGPGSLHAYGHCSLRVDER
jgi:hypothetical protein